MKDKSPHDRIVELRRKHNLGFLHNPGGGEFTHEVHGRCQVPFMDEQEDLDKLLKWLREKGLETAE